MDKLVFLNITGDFDSGFTVNLEITRDKDNSRVRKFGSLPPAPELLHNLKLWQDYYHQFGFNSRIKGKKVIYTSAKPSHRLNELAKQLEVSFQNWLKSPDFQDINYRLREELNREVATPMWLCSDSLQLHQLPWCTWDFFDRYEKIELALSSLDSEQFRKFSFVNKTSKVRILAVLGNNEGIDLNKDREILNNLPDAEVVFLVEPKREVLHDCLWSQSWDIVFFAGHSRTIQEQGVIYLNQEDVLTIEDLKYALKTAIANGLQLAIFNSCQGLGLAKELSRLSLPHAIVMREPITDAIAHKFLEYFLESYSEGSSLSSATRKARERLQAWDKEHPFSSWFPALYQHQGVNSPLWKDLKGEISDIPELTTLPISRSPGLDLVLVLGIGTISAFIVLLLQTWGWLQQWELETFDRALSLRQSEAADERFLIITIGDKDIEYQQQQGIRMQGSLSDTALLQLLNKLEPLQPKVIASDILHNVPFTPELADKIGQTDNFLGICRIENQQSKLPDVSPPPQLPINQVGFSNIAIDSDGVIRRQIIGMTKGETCETQLSLSSQIALKYLDQYDVRRDAESGILTIGEIVFPRFTSSSGAYNLPDSENGSYQILLNYRSTLPETISLQSILRGEKDKELARLVTGKIILIGVEGKNIDVHYTPYSQRLQEKRISGVMIHAQAASNLISSVLKERNLLWWFPDWLESLWIIFWGLIGSAIIIVWYSTKSRAIAIIVSLIGLYSCYFLLMLTGGWITIIAPSLALILSAAITIVVPQNNRPNSNQKLK